jgi:AraC family L-rhamnose operon transcriptional activator RhaR/AraC family L-rhamnose operon regulatory protein RhaS
MKPLKLSFSFENGDCELLDLEANPRAVVHTHTFDELVIVLGGSALHIIGGKEYPLMRGDVFIVCGEQAHYTKTKSRFHRIVIAYKRELFEDIKKRFENISGFRALFIYEPCFRKNYDFKAKLHLVPSQLEKVICFIKQMKEEKDSKRPGYKLSIEYIFRLIIIELCRYYSEETTPYTKELLRISAAIDFMEQNFDQEITLALLANKAGMKLINFCRAFKKTTGSPPINYLIRLRIEKAVEMMVKSPSLRVIDIAMATGFWNSSYFTRKFKQIMKISPKGYLKKQ